MDNKIFRLYTLDYLGKYYFYEADDFISLKEDGKYILDNLKESNRFDYKGASYTYTKFGNISEGITENNVNIIIEPENINVKINDKVAHLDLIYKMDVKRLEDHVRVTTRISEKTDSPSCLLYAKLIDGDDFVKALESVRAMQIKLKEKK